MGTDEVGVVRVNTDNKLRRILKGSDNIEAWGVATDLDHIITGDWDGE